MSYSQEKHLLDRKGSNMNIQIFGTKKSFDTKKAQRYFKERRVKFQFVDLKEKGLSKGELESVAVPLAALTRSLTRRQKTPIRLRSCGISAPTRNSTKCSKTSKYCANPSCATDAKPRSAISPMYGRAGNSPKPNWRAKNRISMNEQPLEALS